MKLAGGGAMTGAGMPYGDAGVASCGAVARALIESGGGAIGVVIAVPATASRSAPTGSSFSTPWSRTREVKPVSSVHRSWWRPVGSLDHVMVRPPAVVRNSVSVPAPRRAMWRAPARAHPPEDSLRRCPPSSLRRQAGTPVTSGHGQVARNDAHGGDGCAQRLLVALADSCPDPEELQTACTVVVMGRRRSDRRRAACRRGHPGPSSDTSSRTLQHRRPPRGRTLQPARRS